MSKPVRKIKEEVAKSLAKNGADAFVNDSVSPNAFYTYQDITVDGEYSDGNIDDSDADNTYQLSYDGASWPIIRNRKMFPKP